MDRCQRASRQYQTSIRGARECRDATLDLRGVAHVDRTHVHSEPWRHGLHDGELTNPGTYVGIPKGRCACHARRNLLEQFQPFPAKTVFKEQKAGGITARPRQAVDEASADRISGTARARTPLSSSANPVPDSSS
jgi:hypothetical protein